MLAGLSVPRSRQGMAAQLGEAVRVVLQTKCPERTIKVNHICTFRTYRYAVTSKSIIEKEFGAIFRVTALHANVFLSWIKLSMYCNDFLGTIDR